MYFHILLKTYIKYFLSVLLFLLFFFVFIDFMVNRGKLPDSINIQILYIFYRSVSSAILLYPLALLFSMLATIVFLIKQNELIAYFSLAYSPKKLLLPFVSLAGAVTIFFIIIQFTEVAYFNSMASQIKKGQNSKRVTENLFFKFNNNVIFITKLDILSKTAEKMKIFVLNKNGELETSFFVKKAIFRGNSWYSDNIIKNRIKNNVLTKEYIKKGFLEGFKPDILNKLETKNALSLKEAIEALYLLQKEKVKTDFIKVYIYNAIIPPLSFIFLMIILFLNAPFHLRLFNINFYISLSVITIIFIWGLFLIVRKMAIGGILNVDILFLTPFFILFSLSIYYLKKI